MRCAVDGSTLVTAAEVAAFREWVGGFRNHEPTVPSFCTIDRTVVEQTLISEDAVAQQHGTKRHHIHATNNADNTAAIPRYDRDA